MAYPQYYVPNNYYQQSPFVNALQQTYQPQHTQQTQQTIGMKIIPVSNKDEANATPVDLVSGIPTFFYNKGTNEIYLKQFDVANGTAILKVFKESVMVENQQKQEKTYRKQRITTHSTPPKVNQAIFLLSDFLLLYNVIMKRQKTSKSVKSSKTKYKFDLKSNIIFEDSTSKNTKVQFIFDKDEPFYKHIYQEGK